MTRKKSETRKSNGKRTRAARVERQSRRAGRSTNAATGQKSQKTKRMSDYDTDRAAGYEKGYEEGLLAADLTHRVHEAVLRQFEYLVEGADRDVLEGGFQSNNAVSTFIVKMEGVREQTGTIPLAGLPGSGVLFIEEKDIPSHSLGTWLRAKVQEHLAATSETLLIVIPAWVIIYLIRDVLSAEQQQDIQETWKSVQKKRKKLRKKNQRELWQHTSCAEIAIRTRDTFYAKEYIRSIQTTAAIIAQTDMSPSEICLALREGQALSAVTPNSYSGDGAHDGIHDSRIAVERSGITDENEHVQTFERAFEQTPDFFDLLG